MRSLPHTRSVSSGEKKVSLNCSGLADAETPVKVRAMPVASWNLRAGTPSSVSTHSRKGASFLIIRACCTFEKASHVVSSVSRVDGCPCWSRMGVRFASKRVMRTVALKNERRVFDP